MVFQMTPFAFSPENEAKIPAILKRYPEGRQASAILPLFELAQKQCGGWLPPEAIRHVTERLGIPEIQGYEVASFYTMFNQRPIGKYHVQVCGTTPCMLRGSEDIMKACERHLGIRCGETTADGQFTLSEVECLGACTAAPVVQINEDYHENLTEKGVVEVLKAC